VNDRRPEDSAPLTRVEKPKYWQIFHPDKPYYPYVSDEELPL